MVNWKLYTCSAWINNNNVSMGGISIYTIKCILLNDKACKTLIRVEMVSERIMIAHLHGNSMKTIIACYGPTHVSEIEDIETFYEQLSDYSRQIPKHNVHIIAGDFNAHLGQRDGFKFAYHEMTNRNDKMLNEYLLENKLICLNTRYQNIKGQLWTHK